MTLIMLFLLVVPVIVFTLVLVNTYYIRKKITIWNIIVSGAFSILPIINVFYLMYSIVQVLAEEVDY